MFVSRDTRRLIEYLPPSWTESDLAESLTNAVIAGESEGDRSKASDLIEKIARRFTRRPMLRTLWNAYYQLAELYALTHHQVGDKELTGAQFEYAGPAARRRYQTKEKRRIDYEASNEIVLPGGVAPDGTICSTIAMPLSAICRTPERQFAEMYTAMVGMEKYATSMGWQAYFWTFTAPGEYHPNPSNGSGSYRGFTPLQAHEWISERFAKVRALFSKHNLPLLGLRVVEIHQDGCPHWHAVLFYPPALAAKFEALIRSHLLRADCTSDEANATKCTAADARKGRVATYAFKYLRKSADASPEGDAVRAQLALWGIRQTAYFGNINISLWRKLRSAPDFKKISDSYPEGGNVSPRSHLIAMWRACRRGDFHAFIVLNGGIGASPYRIISDFNQPGPQYTSVGLVKSNEVPWPIKYISPYKGTVPKERLPAGFVGWKIERLPPEVQTFPLDFSCSLEKSENILSNQLVTVIPNDSRKSKATPYYTSGLRGFFTTSSVPQSVRRHWTRFKTLLIVIALCVVAIALGSNIPISENIPQFSITSKFFVNVIQAGKCGWLKIKPDIHRHEGNIYDACPGKGETE